MKARVAIQVDDRKLEIAEHDITSVGPAEALLAIEACGLCGSDVAKQYKGAFTAKGIVTYPLIPGHEPIGTRLPKSARRPRVPGA